MDFSYRHNVKTGRTDERNDKQKCRTQSAISFEHPRDAIYILISPSTSNDVHPYRQNQSARRPDRWCRRGYCEALIDKQQRTPSGVVVRRHCRHSYRLQQHHCSGGGAVLGSAGTLVWHHRRGKTRLQCRQAGMSDVWCWHCEA